MAMPSLRSDSDLRFDKNVLPAFNKAWNDPDRIGKPALVTMGDLGITDLPAQATCIAYLDVDGHSALDPADPRVKFQDRDLDRIFSFATYREWSRDDYDPRRGLLLMGPSGTGKTVFLRTRFAQRGIPLYSIVGDVETMALDLVQTKEVVNGTTYWEDGPLLKAMREGVPFCIEEIDLMHPGQLAALNEIIEKGRVLLPEDKSMFVAKRGFMVFGTCNSSFTEDRSGSFAGTRRQNTAVLNRFYKHTVRFATVDQEVECILNVRPTFPPELAKSMARFADMTRSAASDNGFEGKRMSQGLSRRHLLDWAEMLQGMAYLKNTGEGINIAEYTLNYVYSANLAPEEKATVEHLMSLAFNADPASGV